MGASYADLEDVFRRRCTAFARALAAVTGTPEAGADAVQEGFARALARRDQFRSEGSLEAWVWRIAIRAALEVRARETHVPAFDALDPSLPEPARDPELAEALRSLPPRRRLVVFLHYLADLSYAEIAQICGISEGTVGATLTQARDKLAKELGYPAAGEVSVGGAR